MCKVYTILPGRDFTFLKNHDNFKLKFCGGRAEKQSPPLQAFCVQLCCWGHRPFVCSRSLICARILHLDKGHTPSLHEDQKGTLSITVHTKFVPDYYYCYYWHPLSVFYISVNEDNNERHMWVKEGTSKRRHLPQHADLRPAFGRWTLHKMTTEKTESWPEQHPVDQNTMHLPGENTGIWMALCKWKERTNVDL